MASGAHIHLVDNERVDPRHAIANADATRKTEQLLQQNHERYHIFFNNMGFHNHIVHHLLSIWAIGAGDKDIQRGYDENLSYQKPLKPAEPSAVVKLHKTDDISPYLDNGKNYSILLKFFTDLMQEKESNWQEVVNKYLFSGSKIAEALLTRMYAGLLHPIIHLGFGIEFQQPIVIAESLAQAAIHHDELSALLLPAETAAKKRQQEGAPPKSIADLLDEIQHDDALLDCVRWNDKDHMRDGVFGRAGERIVELVSQYYVEPNELERKTAEMINAAAYFTAGAQRSGKMIKYDFFLIHSINSSIFWSSFLAQGWISNKNKVRLLEWKVRTDLALYVSFKSPASRLEEIRNYRPQQPSGWEDIRRRVIAISDDGHAAKLVRALEHGQHVCQPYASRDEFRIKHDDWLQMGHMAIDSVEHQSSPRWVRMAGFDEAWSDIPGRANL